ncbi:MAG: TonB-dependent receptor domain-containing protein [Gemmatimonadales bacterium]
MRQIVWRIVVLMVMVWGAADTAAAQGSGRIVGRIIDEDQGGAVTGATVELVGTTRTTTSGLDGRFTLTDIPAGTVTLRVRMLGYTPKTVTGITLTAGGVVEQMVGISRQALQLAEISVSAEAERGSVSEALNQQRNSANVVNAITAEEISRSPDGDAAAAVQRVSGVTVQDGRYVVVRGLGERYTTTSLNGARIPSPEPERRVVPLDLFPSGLIQSITTAKTFTPDLSGDFSGATVDIQTREFPATRRMVLSVSMGGSDVATGKSILRAPRAGGEQFTFGAGSRSLPSALGTAGLFDGPASQDQVNTLVNAFRNSWRAPVGRATPNTTLSLSVGGNDLVFGQRIGYLVSGTYGYSEEVRADQIRAFALATSDPEVQDEVDRYEGSTGRSSALLGGMVNLSTMLGQTSRLALNNTYTRTADNDARREEGESENLGGRFLIDRLQYVERDVWSSQLVGEHEVGRRHRFDWSVARSLVGRREPDRSEIVYALDVDPAGAPLPPVWFSQSNEGAVRTFANLDEGTWEGTGSYRMTLGSGEKAAQFKVGGAVRQTERLSTNQAFSIASTLPRSARELTPEEVFDGRFTTGDENWFRLTPLGAGGSYDATEMVTAGFAMAQLPLTRRLEVVGGVRLEQSTTRVVAEPTVGDPVTINPSYTDLLPSLTLNLRLSEQHVVRASASQTLSRPEYRELAPVQYRDVIGGENVLGNADLRRALIQNYDLRWEWYPRATEVISVGLFAKTFDSPIERVFLATSGTRVITFVNADAAKNIGVEFEIRKNLDLLGEAFRPFGIFSNVTLMSSEITIGADEASKLNDRRAMVGQAPWVVNAGLTYTSPQGRLSGTVLYNVVGRRISSAAEAPLPDIFEESRHVLDLALRFPVAGGLSGKADLKNLLNAHHEVTQGTVVREFSRSGRSFSVGLSWTP